MKARTIKSVLKKKLKELVDSVDDENIKKIFRDETVISGGCIASMLLCEDVNDFDLYFKTEKAARTIAEYYVREFIKANPDTSIIPEVVIDKDSGRAKIFVKSSGVAAEGGDQGYQYFESTMGDEASDYIDEKMAAVKSIDDATKKKYRPIFLSENAITLSGNVQLVIRFYGEPDVIHENYDFVHCMNYWTSWNEKLTLKPEALESLLTRELVYHGSLYPLCSIIRTRKFIKRGWRIGAGAYLKMALQLNEMDLTDPKVLRDQLTGVDMAYFHEIIELADKHIQESKSIDSTYLAEIIDRMLT